MPKREARLPGDGGVGADRWGRDIKKPGKGRFNPHQSPVVGPAPSRQVLNPELPSPATRRRGAHCRQAPPCAACPILPRASPPGRRGRQQRAQLLGQGCAVLGQNAAPPPSQQRSGGWQKLGLELGPRACSDRAGTPSPTSCSVAVPAHGPAPPPPSWPTLEGAAGHQPAQPCRRCPGPPGLRLPRWITGDVNRRRAAAVPVSASLGPGAVAQSTADSASFSLPGPSPALLAPSQLPWPQAGAARLPRASGRRDCPSNTNRRRLVGQAGGTGWQRKPSIIELPACKAPARLAPKPRAVSRP